MVRVKWKGCGISKTTGMLAQKQPYIQRVRNSSLVERSCAENEPGCKHDTEAQETERIGRGALLKRQAVSKGVVEFQEENAGMSSERKVRILSAEYPRFPGKADLPWVSSGPKAQQKCVVDDSRLRFLHRTEQNCSDTEGKQSRNEKTGASTIDGGKPRISRRCDADRKRVGKLLSKPSRKAAITLLWPVP